MTPSKNPFIKHLTFYFLTGIGYLLTVVGSTMCVYALLSFYVFPVASENYYFSNPVDEAIYETKAPKEVVTLEGTPAPYVKPTITATDAETIITKAAQKFANNTADNGLNDRNRNLSIGLSIFLVGLPMHLLFWNYVRKHLLNA